MDALTHCPGCQKVLRVPSNAEGQLIRCPGCQTISRVPSQEDLKDETISSWIEMDVESILQEREQQSLNKNRPRPGHDDSSSDAFAHPKSHSASTDRAMSSSSRSSIEIEDDALTPEEQEQIFKYFDPSFAVRDNHHDDDDETDADRFDILSDRPIGKKHGVSGRMRQSADSDPVEETAAANEGDQVEMGKGPRDAKRTSGDPIDTGTRPEERGCGPEVGETRKKEVGGKDQGTLSGVMPGGGLSSPETQEEARKAESRDVVDEGQLQSRDFDDNPVIEVSSDSGPRLAVQRITPTGVRFAFDARCLESEGFRLSLPIRCVFGGDTDRNHLIARPLVFMDQCMAKVATAESITSNHECRELGDRHPRQWIRQMGRLDKMPKPFDLPLIYYVSHQYAHLSLHCETHPASEGTRCEVLVPDANTALNWLMRVNGVCGEDYHHLEEEVSLLHGSGWKTLSEQCRQRLQIWCKLKPREQFLTYYNDADFNRRDEGLAGLVLTNQRIIFCKYHTRGRLPLNADHIQLISKSVGSFCELYVKIRGRTSRMVKLRPEDYQDLVKRINEHEEHVQLLTT